MLEQKKEQMRREAEARRQENNNASEKETVVTPTGPGASPSRAAPPATQTNARGTTSAQTPTQPKKKLENKYVLHLTSIVTVFSFVCCGAI